MRDGGVEPGCRAPRRRHRRPARASCASSDHQTEFSRCQMLEHASGCAVRLQDARNRRAANPMAKPTRVKTRTGDSLGIEPDAHAGKVQYRRIRAEPCATSACIATIASFRGIRALTARTSRHHSDRLGDVRDSPTRMAAEVIDRELFTIVHRAKIGGCKLLIWRALPAFVHVERRELRRAMG